MTRVKVFGDSHSRYFELNNEVRNSLFLDREIDVEVVKIKAASIKGFGNRESTLGVSRKIESSISKGYSFVVFAFGQVDVELGYYYCKYVKGDNISFLEFSRDILDRYISYVSSLQLNPDSVVFKGINLPVLVYDKSKAIKYTKRIITENTDDDALIDKVMQEMRNTWPSSFARNNNHIFFNRMLEIAVQKKGWKYFDVNGDISCDLSGAVDPLYVPSGNDHHLVDSLAVRSFHIRGLFNVVQLF